MGYFGGNPELVRAARVDDVFSILDYENFHTEYEEKFIELNKNSPD